MSFYENTLITKQDLPKTEIENIKNKYSELINSHSKNNRCKYQHIHNFYIHNSYYKYMEKKIKLLINFGY